jgi:hypothetical protein
MELFPDALRRQITNRTEVGPAVAGARAKTACIRLGRTYLEKSMISGYF